MANSTLLFIADISGFTQFVASRTPEEGVRKAKEMLDIIVRSNKLRMNLCEVEGDAVFFYSDDHSMTFNQLAKQVRVTFKSFQDYLVRNGLETELGIKFIAHAGHCSTLKVGGRPKLFGEEVIRLHRLLKTRPQDMNYLLITEAATQFLQGVPAGEHGSASFEHLGTVEFRVFGRTFLWTQEVNQAQGVFSRFFVNVRYVLSSFRAMHSFATR